MRKNLFVTNAVWQKSALTLIKQKMINVIRKRLEFFILLIMITGCALNGGSIAGGAEKTGTYTYHNVKTGENLFRISSYYYNTTTVKDINAGIEKITKANKISAEQLKVGQKLRIPDTSKKQPNHPLLPPDRMPSVLITQETPEGQFAATEYRPIIKDKAFIWPVKGRIICGFGELDNQGIDILADSETNVLSAYNGSVIFSGITSKYQETIIIEHPDNIYTVYGHDLEIQVKKGATVRKGDTIGKIKSGAKIRYLHFEIRVDNSAVNPLFYLPE